MSVADSDNLFADVSRDLLVAILDIFPFDLVCTRINTKTGLDAFIKIKQVLRYLCCLLKYSAINMKGTCRDSAMVD